MTAFEERIARNEALFRVVNEEIEHLAERFPPDSGPAGFVCECGDAACSQQVDVPIDVYERVRQNPRRFVVLPGHVVPEVERVVEETPGYTVVEKDAPTAARVSERHDPRAGR